MNDTQKRNGGLTARAVLERKLLMGRAASYRVISEKIEEMTGSSVSHSAVRAALTEKELGLPIDRDKIVRQANSALDEIEAEQEADAKAA